MFYTFVWSSPGYCMQHHVPLKALCDSVSQTGTKEQVLNIIFLEGMDVVDNTYLQDLKQPQINLVDYEKEFNEIKKTYQKIFQYYSKFESYCFLRWICLNNIARSRGLAQVWHIDSDVVMHISLDKLAELTIGKTFMLEGCPVLASISQLRWFSIYENQLQQLLNDLAAYSANAFLQKKISRQRDFLLCNQSNFRNPIGSDQDLLQFLIGAQIIPQEHAESIFSTGHFYVQNPLHINDWKNYQGMVDGHSFVANESQIIVNDKQQMAFTHFQGNFATFCNLFYFLDKIKCPSFLIRKILNYEIIGEKFKIRKMAFLLRVFLNRTKMALTRDELVNRFTKDDNYYLVKVLNFLAAK